MCLNEVLGNTETSGDMRRSRRGRGGKLKTENLTAQERRLWTSKGDHRFELARQGTSQVPNEEPIHDSGKGCEEGIQVVVLFFHQLPEVTRCNR